MFAFLKIVAPRFGWRVFASGIDSIFLRRF
jgi:hypothetical protein